MEDLGWTRRRGSSPVARRGRAAARGLDARIRFQHPFMPAGDTSHPNQINPIKNPLDSEHGIYRDHECLFCCDAQRCITCDGVVRYLSSA
jgi:hypothetical protein